MRSNDSVPDLGRYPFTDNHGADYDEQDQRNLCPIKLRDGRVELETDAAGADQAEYGRLANIDAPAENGNAGERRHDLRDDAVGRHLRARRAGRAHGFHLALIDLFDRFVEQLGAKADRAQRDSDDAGEGQQLSPLFGSAELHHIGDISTYLQRRNALPAADQIIIVTNSRVG